MYAVDVVHVTVLIFVNVHVCICMCFLFYTYRFNEVVLESGLILVHPLLIGISSRVVYTRAATMVTRTQMKSMLHRRKHKTYRVNTGVM